MRELQRLKSQHQTIINMALSGLDRTQIATQLDKSPQTIGMVLNSPLVQSELARRRETINQKVDENVVLEASNAKRLVEEASEDAARTMVGLLHDESPRIQFSAARDLLDRAMGRAQDKSEKPPTLVIDAETINLLSVAFKESVA